MKRQLTVENFRWHAHEIGRAFDIDIVEDEMARREDAMAGSIPDNRLTRTLERMTGTKLAGRRIVYVYPITDETSYVVAMHELGHHTAPNGRCAAQKPKPGCHPREWFEFFAAKLTCEEAAWEWAKYFVEQVFDWTPAMEQVKEFGLGTYRRARMTGGRPTGGRR